MKKIYKVSWSITIETKAAYDTQPRACYAGSKEKAVLVANNIRSAFFDLGFTKDQLSPITIEELELT